MPEALSGLIGAGLSAGDLALLLAVAFAAGMVRGFAGFGTALVYLPVAGQVLDPVQAILSVILMDLVGPIPNLPRGWREAERRDLARLVLGMVVALPLGLALLARLDPQVFRYVVSLLSLGMLVLLVSGLRYHGPMTPPMVVASGAVGGFLGGVAGVPGPPVILLYMASDRPAQVIRANTLLYLFAFDASFILMMLVRGEAGPAIFGVGLLLIAPNLLGNLVGARLFRPERGRLFRAVAYGMIALSALSGLPFWDRG